MKNYITLILCLCALFLNSCKKPESEHLSTTTEQITGNNGQTILGGSGLPNVTLGNNGDFYLDKSTANLYGPKVDNAWPQPFNLANNTGTTGTPGTKILSGTIAPTLNIGAVGDFYFDTAALNFYGPKTSASWGLPINLKVQTDGAKVLIYKNQVFNSVVRDTMNAKILQRYIEENIKYKNSNEQSIAQYKDTYDRQVKNIPSSYTDTQKQALLNQYKTTYDNSVAYYLKEITRLDTERVKLEKDLAIGNFILNSEIAIDAKYQNYYDNGMVVVYLSNPLATPHFWDNESVTLIETKDIMNGYTYTATSAYCSVDKIAKDKIYLRGGSYRVDEALVKAAKFDIKIVFIPASDVQIMSAAKVDTHNLKAVSRYLGVALNK